MAKQTLNVGTSDGDNTGESLRSGGVKINANFGELYAAAVDPIAATVTSGLVNYPREVANTPAASATAVVLAGNGGLAVHKGTQTVPLPSHYIGLLGRVQNQGTGVLAQGIGVEGRGDHTAGNITEGIGFLAVVGDNTDNPSGQMGVWNAFKTGDNSSASYSRVLTRNAFLNDDPGAPMVSKGRFIGPFGRSLGSVAQTYNGGEVAPAAHSGLVAGVRYGSRMTVAGSPLALSANLIYYVPVFVPERGTLSKFGCNVTTLASGKFARIGMWPLVKGVAAAKVAECAAFSVGATGDIEGSVSGSIVVEAGQYVLGICSDGAPTIKAITDYTLGGTLGVTNAAADDTLIYTAFTYATLPSTPAFTRVSNSGWTAPHLWFTVA